MTFSAAVVRDATRDDIPAIQAVEQASSAAHWAESEYCRVFDPTAARRVLLVAEGKTEPGPLKIGGFIVARAVGDEWEVENVAVAAEWRRKSVGHLMVACIITRARRENARLLQLEVRASNAAAIALYVKCGFQQVGARKDYYSNPPEDALLFSLSLGNSS